MDVSAAGGKIGDITAKIIIFDKKVKDTYNKYAKRINELIDDLEDTLNRLIQATESTIKIIEMKLEKTIKRINDAIDGLMKKINKFIKDLEKWCNDTIDKIKISFIRSVSAKLGIELAKDAAALMSDIIPTPKIEIPKISIDLRLPNLSDLIKFEEVKLKKLPLL